METPEEIRVTITLDEAGGASARAVGVLEFGGKENPSGMFTVGKLLVPGESLIVPPAAVKLLCQAKADRQTQRSAEFEITIRRTR